MSRNVLKCKHNRSLLSWCADAVAYIVIWYPFVTNSPEAVLTLMTWLITGIALLSVAVIGAISVNNSVSITLNINIFCSLNIIQALYKLLTQQIILTAVINYI